MHSHTQSHHSIVAAHWSPANAALTILLVLLFLIFLLVFLNITALPAQAQNAVPPTARQAASMPQFAARLAHAASSQMASRAPYAAQPRASYKNPLAPRARAHRGGPLDDNTLYENGPINGTTDAWTINFGFVVSDTFTVPSGGSSVNGLTFGAWVEPGDVLQSVEVSISSQTLGGGTTYFDQAVNFTQSDCSSNQYGYNVCTEAGNFTVNLAQGTYWMNLQNAVVTNGDPVYWDENSGAGCQSPGCPSEADESSIGTIPSEAFTILGGNTITCANLPVSDEVPVAKAKAVTVPPSPDQAFRVIYNFTGGADGGTPTAGLTIDTHGNLIGTASAGGDSGEGTVFKLTPSGSSWRFTRLYSFSGTDGSDPDSPPAVASNGIVYGTTGGGGSVGDGVLFGLSPFAHALPNALSNWTERLLYSFTGGSDGAGPGGSLVLDHSGNIYGTTGGGGANGGGTLYEFTNGGIQVLHAFPAFSGDGRGPLGAVSGAGGLYGMTGAGGAYDTGTVYTLAGGYDILYNFNFQNGQGEAGWPLYLAADQAGNLYGSATYGYLINGCYYIWYGTIFELTYPDWTLVTLRNWSNVEYFNATLTPDASGNVYGTVNTGAGDGEVFQLTCCWSYTSLHDFSGPDGAYPSSAPVVDAQGNVYGVTLRGGAYGYGVVWEISP